MRIPDFKNLELKHVTFSKGYDDKDTLKDFVKIRHYFDELEDYEISIDKRKKKEFTEKELDEGISIEMNNKDMAYFLILLNGKDIGFTSIRYSPNLEIIALFIDKKFRNKGYGAKIIHKLEKILWNERHRSKDKGASKRCKLQLTTKIKLSKPSRAANVKSPFASISSISPSPRKAYTF